MARTRAAPVRQRYFVPLKTTQDWDEASELVARYLPIVHHVVRRYHCNAIDREDLYQEGCLVILEAARDYQETSEESFERFVTRAIERRLRQCRRATVRVALDWTLDLLFSKDLVQFQTVRGSSVSRQEEGRRSEPSIAQPVLMSKNL